MELFNEDGVSINDVDERGRSLSNGRFVKGFAKSGGRKKGSRNVITQRMLDAVEAREDEEGLSVVDVLLDIAFNKGDKKAPIDLQMKAAAKVADLLYPKSASVDVKVDDHSSKTAEEIDAELKALLAGCIVTSK